MIELENIVGKENVKYDEPMCKHTSFKIGGNADIYVTVDDIHKLEKILKIIDEKKIPITIVGNGTNLLVKDEGIRGIVIRYIAEDYEINEDKDNIFVVISSGILNGKLSQILLKHEISGFEFGAGIPGTIGGAVFMNAGAFGSEMKDIVKETTYIDLNDKKIYNINTAEHKFEYRKSIFENKKAIILNTKLQLKNDKYENIRIKMDEYRKKRMGSQPLDKPSAGSTFKRGNDFITAKLIDEAGLKGYKIGGAKVSDKHAGFIINDGNATANDVIKLIKYVQNKIFNEYGKNIETEVRILG